MIIGVLGPEGSFSQKASNLWHDKCDIDTISLNYYGDIPDVFQAAIKKEIDVGIVPVENSIEGSVGITLDELFENPIKIIGEVIVPIHHCLVSKGDLEDIKIILSHPQAIAQCRCFLKKYFNETEIRTTGSTSHAAKLANEFNEMAAIASSESAENYGLNVLIKDVQDRKNNFTRFIAISSSQNKQLMKTIFYDSSNKKNNIFKTSLIFYLENDHPGALYNILGEFATRNINLTKIESRPSKKALGDYIFYIDLSGHIDNDKVRDAINSVSKKVNEIKLLGSYIVQ
ncbi:prephenate dehydratase [Methanosalsum natronophilum]|uniref:prephenate dehydratase n=1 Tax=Methanosalsum natronophilum TaxID=768733 RepID=UPI00216945BE|nr:prephenate dehydratase [Methanosalsum natronophilum]MCS3924701.1 prephenate dehydratase [Methanosalsum natronophilum]